MIRLLLLAVGLVALPAVAAPELLDAREAFRLTASHAGKSVEVRFRIAEGYYLYRDKLQLGVEPAGAASAAPRLPRGTIKVDEFFGRTEVYRRNVAFRLPLAKGRSAGQILLKVRSQGCADVGVCYPPREEALTLNPGDVDRPPDSSPRPHRSLVEELGEPAPATRK